MSPVLWVLVVWLVILSLAVLVLFHELSWRERNPPPSTRTYLLPPETIYEGPGRLPVTDVMMHPPAGPVTEPTGMPTNLAP